MNSAHTDDLQRSVATDAECLHRRFEAQVARHATAAAVTAQGRTLSYQELDQQANALAARLRQAGVEAGSLVGLCVERTLDLPVGILGILKSGAAYVPLDPGYPAERLAHMLDQAAPVAVVSRSNLHARLPGNAPALVDCGALSTAPCAAPTVTVTGDDLCYVIFTSGSTGTPKGVMVTHRNVARLFPQLAESIGFSSADVWSQFHSYAFGFSAWEIFGALLSGAHLAIVDEAARADPRELADFLRRSGTTILSQTPSAFRRFLAGAAGDIGQPPLRLIMLSGEPVAADDLRAWFGQTRSDRPRLLSSYAITETGGQVALREYTSRDVDAGNARDLGFPLRDTPVWVLDTDGEPVRPGAVGELCVGGPGLARGYLNDPELTGRRFVTRCLDGTPQRVYMTGDRAQLHADGRLEFAGRSDSQVKLRGYRIELGEIEARLAQHPGVQDCAVVLDQDAAGASRLVAYAVTAEPVSVTALREHLAGRLPEPMVPGVYVFLDQLPLTANGKLDRRGLPRPGRARPALATPCVPPATPLQAELAAAWATVLELDEVGIDDDFFALGGDSILALRLTTELRQRLGNYVQIAMLLDAPTVRQLAALLSAGTAANSGTRNVAPAVESLPLALPDHAARYAPFPLTDIQQAYWVGRGADFALGKVATHLYIEIDASGLDLGRLERAWQQVVARHPMLRAIINADGSQQVLPQVPDYRFKVQDLRDMSATEAAAELTRERERLSHQVLPSDRWPLFELAASLLPEDLTRLHISLDCLITDARSFQIISNELLHFYSDDPAPLPLPGLSFRDYVMAERKLRETALYARALAYWQERLPALPDMPQLPLAQAPEQLEEHRFVQRAGQLAPADWQRLQARAARAGITPTAILLQCFGETLAAWCRQQALTLNLTLFNRLPLHPDVDNVVGDFTSLVLLGISDLDSGDFAARAARLQRELWQGVDHRFVSGVQVLRELARQRGSVQSMMPVVFTSTLGIGTGGQDSMAWHRLGKQVYSVSQTPQVWLDHVAGERDGALYYTWDVVEALFPPGLIDAVFAAYGQRLTALATAESAWQESWSEAVLGVLPATQLQRRAAVNATDGPVPAGLLHAGFMARALQQPDAPAVWSSARALSYRELDELSNQLAHSLQAAGVQPNQLVAVVMDKCWQQIVAVLGILKAGGAYLPIDPGLPPQRLRQLLDTSAATLALTAPTTLATSGWPAQVRSLVVADPELADWPATPPACPAQQADMAYVIFTSGSTGVPKGVVIDHRGAVNTCDDINARLQISPADSMLALSALNFDLSVYDIFGMLAAGARLVLPEPAGLRDPAHWAGLIAAHGITCWNTVPALLDLLTEYAEQQSEPFLDSLRVALLSGDWIPVNLPARVRALAPADIYSLGGATEASIWSIIYPVSAVPPEWTSIPYGKPLRNQRMYVLNDQMLPCPDWVPGELYIGGIGLAIGYWRDAEKTAARFVTHPHSGERLYRTGDIGRYLPDGNIEFLGREDFQVKVQGYRVELGDIEAALAAHPGVRSCVVVARGPARGAQRLVGYYVPDTGSRRPVHAELSEWLSARLPEYMIPARLVALPELPLTANGKLDRDALPEPAPAPAQSAEPSAATSGTGVGSANAAVGDIVRTILNSAEIAPDANLLQVGATSIEMIRIANGIDKQFGWRPRMDAIYREPTIAGLTKLVAANALQVSDRPATPADITDPLLTPPQLLADVEQRLDPDVRARFKAGRPGLRRLPEGATRVALPRPADDRQLWLEHRSQRWFAPEPLPVTQLATLLECLSSVTPEDRPKYRYASAGGLYPVQCYLYIKPDRVSGCAGGSYYYAPDTHELVAIGAPDPALRDRYDPLVNRPIFDAAAFAIYLVTDMAVLGSMYPEHALHYAVLEAGHMTQLLESTAPATGTGLCQTGGLAHDAVHSLLQLSPTDLLLHGLLGGGAAAERPAAVPTDDSAARDEGEL
ncbi:MAG: amino acid adenylation domain-containing protein [Gammaproteobacteria bacterium]|jgi:amino acid adenylation domain-containing protein|nr:amino acid adenylation domain-containing protein [Gammaproteobacteria bacterium]